MAMSSKVSRPGLLATLAALWRADGCSVYVVFRQRALTLAGWAALSCRCPRTASHMVDSAQALRRPSGSLDPRACSGVARMAAALPGRRRPHRPANAGRRAAWSPGASQPPVSRSAPAPHIAHVTGGGICSVLACWGGVLTLRSRFSLHRCCRCGCWPLPCWWQVRHPHLPTCPSRCSAPHDAIAYSDGVVLLVLGTRCHAGPATRHCAPWLAPDLGSRGKVPVMWYTTQPPTLPLPTSDLLPLPLRCFGPAQAVGPVRR